MRMPFIEFITNGDLKFMLIVLALLIFSMIIFFKKINNKENQLKYNQKLNKLSNWSFILAIFSFFLGLMHSLYFISNVGGIAPNLLYRGLANTLITPVFGIAICIIIKLLAVPFKEGKKQIVKS